MTADIYQSDRGALEAAIIAQPDLDAIRLELADWLEEHDRKEKCPGCSVCVSEPEKRQVRKPVCGGTGHVPNYYAERAELIRVQVELARLPSEKIGWRFLADGPSTTAESRAVADEDPRRERLRRRERELLDAHFTEWFIIGQWSPSLCRGTTLEYWAQGGEHPEPMRVTVRRGFVGEITLTLAAFAGERCGRCGGRGTTTEDPQNWEWDNCPDCRGTGYVGGLAAELASRCPLEAVRLSDREPYIYHGVHYWSRRSWGGTANVLPDELFSLLPDKGLSSDASSMKGFPTSLDARVALSNACVLLLANIRKKLSHGNSAPSDAH